MRFTGMIALGSLALSLLATTANAAWTVMTGGAHRIAVEPNNERHVWKVVSGAVYELTTLPNTWTQRDAAGTSTAWLIALPNDPSNNRNIPYIVLNNTTIERWDAASSSFVSVSGGGLAYGIAVQNNSGTLTPWVIGTDNNPYVHDGANWQGPYTTPFTGGFPATQTTEIAVDGSGMVWIASYGGQIARFVSGAFSLITATDTAYRLSGAAIAKASDQRIYLATSGSNPATWGTYDAPALTEAPTNGAQLMSFARGNTALWAIDDSSTLYRCAGAGCF